MTHAITLLLVGIGFLINTAHAAPRVSVTDLTYQETVSEYFKMVSAHQKSSLRASARERESDTWDRYSSASSGRLNAKSESSYTEVAGTYTYIDRGELRKFTADIKGEMLKSGAYRLVQARPYTMKNTEKIYDIIKRIREGYYPGADYVLFGTVSSIQFRDEANPVVGSDTISRTLGLELVADFSLINTKTYEIRAAFSATGEGQDVKLIGSRGGHVVMNRGKVISETSKSLGLAVAQQLQEQLSGVAVESKLGAASSPPATESVDQITIYK